MPNSRKLGLLTLVAALGLVGIAVAAALLNLHTFGVLALIVVFVFYTAVLSSANVRLGSRESSEEYDGD